MGFWASGAAMANSVDNAELSVLKGVQGLVGWGLVVVAVAVVVEVGVVAVVVAVVVVVVVAVIAVVVVVVFVREGWWLGSGGRRNAGNK